MSTRACRYCGKMIRFVATPGGRQMPINLDPDPLGNVVMRDGLARVLTAAQVAAGGPGGRYMPHQATCEARAQRGRAARKVVSNGR